MPWLGARRDSEPTQPHPTAGCVAGTGMMGGKRPQIMKFNLGWIDDLLEIRH